MEDKYYIREGGLKRTIGMEGDHSWYKNRERGSWGGFTLERISNESRSPTSEVASQSLGTINLAESLKVALVHIGIDLTTTLD